MTTVHFWGMLLLLASLSAEARAVNVQHKVSQQTLNSFVDAAFRHLRKTIKNRFVEPIGVAGAGPLGEGFFTGLGNVHRLGDATILEQSGANRTIAATALLRGNSQLSFPCSRKLFSRNNCDNAVDLRFHGFKLYLVLRPNWSNDALPQLDICDVSDLGRITVDLGKDGIFGSVLSWMGAWVSTLLKSKVASNLEDGLCKAIASNL